MKRMYHVIRRRQQQVEDNLILKEGTMSGYDEWACADRGGVAVAGLATEVGDRRIYKAP